MVNSDQEYLLELWNKNICPNCGKNIAEGTRVGSGKKSEGGFCSLDCYAEYRAVDILQRARHVSELLRRQQGS